MSPHIVEIPQSAEDKRLADQLSRLGELLEEAQKWADEYARKSTTSRQVRNIRRDAQRAARAARRRMCIGLFGESQVGKSFLIGQIGRAGQDELTIACQAQGRNELSFMKHINPQRDDEATAVVCRLTVNPPVQPEHPGRFVARLLSPAGLLKSLATGVMMDCEPPLIEDLPGRLDELLSGMPASGGPDSFVEMLDDAWSFMQAVTGGENREGSYNYYQELLIRGNIRARLNAIKGKLSAEQRGALASTLWGMGQMPAIDALYGHLAQALDRVAATEYVELEFDAVADLRKDARDQEPRTVVDLPILKDLMRGHLGTTKVHLGGERDRAVEMDRASVCAIIAELYLPVVRGTSASSHLLDRADILDFPGARTGKGGAGGGFTCAGLVNDPEGRKRAIELFKRGKLTHLFEVYCMEREINVLALCLDLSRNQDCHHLPDQIRRWLDTRYPKFDALDEEEIDRPSLFIIATKFDRLIGPNVGIGHEGRWDTMLSERLVHFMDRPIGVPAWQAGDEAQRKGWLNVWGPKSAGRFFANVCLVRDPVWAISRELLDQHRELYRASQMVGRHVADPHAKWDAVAPTSPEDKEHTGIALLMDAIGRKLRPELKRLELSASLSAMLQRLGAALADEYVPVEGEGRLAAERAKAARVLALVDPAKRPRLFGQLLHALSLPPEIVHRQLCTLSEGAAPLMIDQQITEFVDALMAGWMKYVNNRLAEERGLLYQLSEESDVICTLVSNLTQRARADGFKDSLHGHLRFFFQHPQGPNYFRHSLTAICCRKWSDLVATFGYEMPPAALPALPPRLNRTVPWARYHQHWGQHVERLFVENNADLSKVPPGNHEAGQLLGRVRQFQASTGQAGPGGDSVSGV